MIHLCLFDAIIGRKVANDLSILSFFQLGHITIREKPERPQP